MNDMSNTPPKLWKSMKGRGGRGDRSPLGTWFWDIDRMLLLLTLYWWRRVAREGREGRVPRAAWWSVPGLVFMLFAPILVAMMAVVLVTGVLPGMGVVVPTWSWLLLPFAAVLLAVFSAGVAMFFARLGARAPDIANAMPFILTLGRYASGAMFLISAMVPDELWLKPLLLHQPVAIYLELFRAAFGNEPLIPMTPGLWLEATAWAVGVFAIGFLYFWRAEETYGRD